MTYATQDDLVSRFGETEIIQLSDRANTGAIDAAVIADKLTDADAEIDSYLAGRYTLPLSPVPLTLQRLACDIARYHLYDDRPIEYVVKRYEAAIRFLEMVAKGTVQLGTDSSGQVPPSADSPAFVSPAPVFNRCTLKDYVG
ncbi:gp436 family protein [Pseudoxanthomonas sp. UTMC 1351]|uniref:gp436 family protein n=1 Tax=Pseudoxanthomonas sp. UTMC 1351 TaxID=2695853 RepID=UPI0034CE4EA5